MSAVIKTINALKEIHIGNYVQFHKDKFGYVEQILPNDLIRIVEDDGSLRPRHYHVRKKLVAVIPKSGESPAENRTLRQPPVPTNAITPSESDDETDIESVELITALKTTKYWTFIPNMNNNVNKNPFYEYMKKNDHLEKGWIRPKLPTKIRAEQSKKTLNKKEKMLFV